MQQWEKLIYDINMGVYWIEPIFTIRPEKLKKGLTGPNEETGVGTFLFPFLVLNVCNYQKVANLVHFTETEVKSSWGVVFLHLSSKRLLLNLITLFMLKVQFD